MLLVAQLLCLLGLALGNSNVTDLQSGTVHATPSAEVKLERGPCPTSWYYNGRCFKYVYGAMSWARAELNCLVQNANLVSIHSQGEQDFVRDLIKNFDPQEKSTWIGMSDIHMEGRWMWSDGSRVNFTGMWEDGQPDGGKSQNCAVTNDAGSLKWHDEECSHDHPSVCALRTVFP